MGSVAGGLMVVMTCEFVALSLIPSTSRQVVRTTNSYVDFLEVTKQVLTLFGEYVDEVDDLLSYENTVGCAVKKFAKAVDEVSGNCTAESAGQLSSAIEYFWNSTDAYVAKATSGELNCNVTVPKKNGFLAVYRLCRGGCAFAEEIPRARETFRNLTTPTQFAMYIADVSSAVATATSAIVESQAALNDFSSVVGFASDDNDDDACSDLSAVCDSDFFQYADGFVGISDDFQSVATCMTTITTNVIPVMTTTDMCQPQRDFRDLRQLLKYVQFVLRWTKVGIDLLVVGCDVIKSTNKYVLLASWLIFAVAHVLTFLFLEYIVYFPNATYRSYLRKSILGRAFRHLLGCCSSSSSKKKTLPASFSSPSPPPPPPEDDDEDSDDDDLSTRESEEENMEDSAVTKRDDDDTGRRRSVGQHVSYLGTKAQATLTRGSVLAAKFGRRRASDVANHACDSHYAFRFWLLYVIHDLLLWITMFLLLITLIMALAGNRSSCTYVYETLYSRTHTLLTTMTDTAANSCLVDLRQEATTQLPPIRDKSHCTVSTTGVAEYAAASTALVLFALLIALIQWHFIKWLPAAFGFARPATLRRRLAFLLEDHHQKNKLGGAVPVAAAAATHDSGSFEGGGLRRQENDSSMTPTSHKGDDDDDPVRLMPLTHFLASESEPVYTPFT